MDEHRRHPGPEQRRRYETLTTIASENASAWGSG